MQTPSVDWTSIISQALTTLGPAFLTLGGTFLGLWYQRKIKQDEIAGSAKLKARELVFQTYQKRFDRINETVESLSKVLSKIRSQIKNVKHEADFDAVEKAFEEASPIIQAVELHFPGELKDIERELYKAGLLDKYREKLDTLNALEEAEIEPSQQSIVKFVGDLESAIPVYFQIEQALLEWKSQVLFGEYLPKEALMISENNKEDRQ